MPRFKKEPAPKKLTLAQQAAALKLEGERLAKEAEELLAREVRAPGKTVGYSVPGDNGFGAHYAWEKADFGPGWPFVPSKIPGMTISHMEDGTEVYKITINGVRFILEIGQMNYVPEAVSAFFNNAMSDYLEGEYLKENGVTYDYGTRYGGHKPLGTWHYEHGVSAWLDVDGFNVDTSRYSYIIENGVAVRVPEGTIIPRQPEPNPYAIKRGDIDGD